MLDEISHGRSIKLSLFAVKTINNTININFHSSCNNVHLLNNKAIINYANKKIIKIILETKSQSKIRKLKTKFCGKKRLCIW